MRSHNYYKVGVHRAELQCHSERSEESMKTSKTRGFFVVPPRAGLLRMTGSNRFSGWTLAGTVLIVCVLLLGGCLGKGTQQATRFYLLQPIANMSSGEQASAEGEDVGLAIGPVRVREYLNQPQIVTRTKENKIIIHDFHSWGEPLDRNLIAVMAENLSDMLTTDKIIIFPWRRRPDLDYQVVVDVIRFDGELGGEASLLAHYAILDFGGSEGEERRIGIWKSSFSRQMKDDSYEALVSAMSELVGDLSREIAERIKGLSGS